MIDYKTHNFNEGCLKVNIGVASIPKGLEILFFYIPLNFMQKHHFFITKNNFYHLLQTVLDGIGQTAVKLSLTKKCVLEIIIKKCWIKLKT